MGDKQKAMTQKMAKLNKSNKNKNKSSKSKRKRIDYLKLMREQQKRQESMMKVRYPTICTIQQCKINGIDCEWLKYKGSDISNGIIMIIHGGAYIMGSSAHKHRQSEFLSKSTGCVCLLINYSLAPESPIPRCIDEIISVYDYLLNTMNISPNNISMEGESAGGGAILLSLQKMKYELNMPLPCCVWVNSPWTDLSSSLPSITRNAKFDCMLTFDKKKIANNWAVGNVDYFGNKTGKDFDLKSKVFSPLYGNWNGLCPVYFMVGATEVLLDDTIYAGKRAYDSGVNVKVDIDPFGMHAWCIFAQCLESQAAIQRGAEWILQHLPRKTFTSKL